LGTDLDKATQAQLDRGYRMVELLKQPQYQPMEVYDQVVSIFAGTNGLLDDIELGDICEFEKQMLVYLKEKHSELLTELRSKGKMDDQLRDALGQAIVGFRETFSTKLEQNGKRQS